MGKVGSFKSKFVTFASEEKLLSNLPNVSTSLWERELFLYKELLSFIQSESEPSFLLPAVIRLLAKAKAQGLPDVSFQRFELYLIRLSGLSYDDEMKVRGKIAGRFIPQDAYQKLFPIGLKGSLPGSCVVFAHKSPDLDTITASFFAWLDAFAAKVGTGLHKWNIQVDEPVPQIHHTFAEWFGKEIFDVLAVNASPFSLCAEDFVQFEKSKGQDPSVDLKTPVSEIRQLLEHSNCVSVKIDKEYYGVIHKEALDEDILGSVILRDFCNAEEGKWENHLEVISVLDHHRFDLSTSKPPCVLAGDVQSSNTITYELSAELNQRFGLGPFTEKDLREGKVSLSLTEGHAEKNRSMARLSYSKNLDHRYFVSKDREFVEYLLLLYAIFDDTDLLAKMTRRDLCATAGIVNQLKGIVEGEYHEVFSIDECLLVKDVKAHAKSMLQNDEMYSIYQSVYAFKEAELERDLIAASKGKKNFFFSDTKEQKGCARIGQAKVFPNNVTKFLDLSSDIQNAWLALSKEAYEKNAALKLHNLMISTLESADDLYRGKVASYQHSDELWFWIPDDQEAKEKLAVFFDQFNASPSIQGLSDLEMTFYGSEDAFLFWKEVVEKHLPKVVMGAHHVSDKNIAVLSIPAGSITSRKSQVTPFLP